MFASIICNPVNVFLHFDVYDVDVLNCHLNKNIIEMHLLLIINVFFSPFEQIINIGNE